MGDGRRRPAGPVWSRYWSHSIIPPKTPPPFARPLVRDAWAGFRIHALLRSQHLSARKRARREGSTSTRGTTLAGRAKEEPALDRSSCQGCINEVSHFWGLVKESRARRMAKWPVPLGTRSSTPGFALGPSCGLG